MVVYRWELLHTAVPVGELKSENATLNAKISINLSINAFWICWLKWIWHDMLWACIFVQVLIEHYAGLETRYMSLDCCNFPSISLTKSKHSGSYCFYSPLMLNLWQIVFFNNRVRIIKFEQDILIRINAIFVAQDKFWKTRHVLC